MEWLKKTSEQAHDWLASKPPHQWSLHAFDVSSKSDHRTNNMTENFNSELREIRSFNPLKLVNELRRQLMMRFHKRYAKGTLMDGKVTKDAKTKLVKLENQSRMCKLIPGRDELYEVVEGPNSFAVNLNANTCNCNWWDISGLPCKHAVKALIYKRANLEEYCHPYYSVDNYLTAYHGVIHPIPTSELASAPTTVKILPPPGKRKPGRPRMARKRDADEGPARKRSNTVRCSKCRQTGHNSRGCQGGPTKNKKSKKKTTQMRNNTFGSQLTPTAAKKRKSGNKGTAKSTQRKKQRKTNENVCMLLHHRFFIYSIALLIQIWAAFHVNFHVIVFRLLDLVKDVGMLWVKNALKMPCA